MRVFKTYFRFLGNKHLDISKSNVFHTPDYIIRQSFNFIKYLQLICRNLFTKRLVFFVSICSITYLIVFITGIPNQNRIHPTITSFEMIPLLLSLPGEIIARYSAPLMEILHNRDGGSHSIGK